MPLVKPTFVDIPFGYWSWREIEIFYRQNITKGCREDEKGLYYCPTDPVTRDQMAVFLARALKLDTSRFDPQNSETWSANFSDVSPDYWAWKEIQALHKEGITNGCDDQDGKFDTIEFCPTQIVTRDQMASFLVRALNIPM